MNLDTPCWPWPGRLDRDGYGRARGPENLAHRVAYAAANGEIPPGLEVDHLCNNRACVNPLHLELVTRQENNARRWERRTHCDNGHELSEENTRIGVDAREGYRRRFCRACDRARTAAYRARKRAKPA